MPATAVKAVPRKGPIVPSDCDVVPMTEALAAKFRDMPPLPGERILRDTRIAYLLKAIEEVVLPFLWVQVHVNGRTYRANGQTTSHIFSEGSARILKGMPVVVTTYDVDAIEDASTVYGAIDSGKSVRTISDITNAYHGGNPRLQKHNKTYVQLCQTGLAYAVYGLRHDRRRNLTPLQRGALLHDNLDFIDATSKIIQGKTPETAHMWRAPVIASMKLTYDTDKIAFREFWCYVQHGNNAPRTPITLRDYLRSTNLSASAVNLRTDSAPAMFEKCIRAWNAWRRGEDMRKILAVNSVPKIL